MKFCKRILSLFLAVLMVTSVVTAVDFSAKAFESSADVDLTGTSVDITFVIDSTGSMSSKSSIISNISTFLNNLTCEGVDYRVAVIDYKDVVDDGINSTKIHYFGESNWSSNVFEIKNELSKIRINGGGDSDETPTEAIANVLNSSWNWRVYTSKCVFLLTDAGYKETGSIPSMSEIIKDLKEKNIQTSVVTTNSLKSTYKSLYENTGGMFFNIFSSECYELINDYVKNIVCYNDPNSILVRNWDELGIGDFHEYLSSFISLSRAIIKSYESNEKFVSTAAKWKAAHLAAKPGDTYDELFSMKTIYASILMAMINDKFVDENYVTTMKQQSKLDYANCYNNYLKILNNCTDIDLKKLTNSGKYTESERTKILKQLAKSQAYSDNLSAMNDAVKWGSTINETINIFVNYSNLKSTKESIVKCLRTMSSHCNDLFLKSAIDEIVYSTESSFNAYITATLKGAEVGLNDVGAELINKAWASVLKSNPITKGMLIGYNIGSSICNFLFKTDKQIANYYEFIALYEIEKTLMATINDFENNYSYSLSSENAINYISSVSLFFKLQYQTVEITNELYKIRNLCPFSRIFYNGKKTFEELIASSNELRRTLKDYEGLVFRTWIYALKDINSEVYEQIKNDVSMLYEPSLKNALVRVERLSYEYNGTAIKPNVIVIQNNSVLTENKDYNIEYSDNVNPGLGRIKITPAKGSYFTDSQETTFVIKEPPFKKRYSVFSRSNKSNRARTVRRSNSKSATADIPDISVYDAENNIVAQILDGQIVNEQLPVYIEDGRVDVFMYDDNYRVSIDDESQDNYDAEIQNIDEGMQKESVKAYNNITADAVEHYIYKDGTDKFLINESVVNSTYDSSENNIKYDITLTDAETIDGNLEAYANQRVYISAVEKEGYYFSGWNVSDDVVLNNDNDSITYFIMPNHSVEISATLSKNEYYFALKDKIEKAQSYSNEVYSKSSYDELQNVIVSAKEIDTNYITESEYNNAVKKIDAAVNSLVECEHQYDVKTFEHSCTNDYLKIYTCTKCKYEKQETVLGSNHNYIEKENTSTCTDSGTSLSVCDICGDILVVKTDALGHAYSESPNYVKLPTCNADGYNEYVCSRCNATRKDEIAKLDGSALTSAIDEAKTRIESGVFTEKSVAELQNVYDEYKNAADELHTQTEVDNAVSTITSAYSTLVVKDVVTYGDYTFTKADSKLTVSCEGEAKGPNLSSSPLRYCGAIEEISFSEGVTSIASSAFTSTFYKSVKKLDFPSTLTKINTRAFEYCSLIEELVIPDSVTFVGYGSFASLTSLKKVTVPASAKYASYAFEHDENIEEIVVTPGSDGIMSDCTRTGQFGFPPFQNSTGAYGPWRVAKNATVTVQAGVTSIGLNAFYNAVSGNLTINIPASVNNIGKTCFATNGKTVAYVENSNCMIDETNLCSSNVSVMVKSEDGEYAQKPHTHIWGDWTQNEDLTYTRTCIACGQADTQSAEEVEKYSIKTVSLSLESSITMNFKVLKNNMESFDSFYMTFKCGDKEETVTEYTEQGSYYVFSYTGISPQLMNDDVTAVLHATANSVEYTSPKKTMSVKTYAYTMLNRYGDNESYSKLCTLLVDLLNYGSAAQTYVGYETDSLVNAELTDAQKSFASQEPAEFDNIRNYNYKTIDNPTVKWTGCGLVLNNSVMIRAKFSTTDVENKTVEIGINNTKFTYTKDDFVNNGDGTYYVYCNEIFANEMSDEILFTVYENGKPCSDTMRFSVESYAALVKANYNGAAIDKLTTAMMLYGKSAKAYGA